MKKIIYIIYLLVFTSYSQVFAYDTKQENVLLQRLNSAPNDTTKLAILYDLVDITTDEPERNTHYINVLLEEAEKQKNSYYKCQAYLFHIVIAFNMYDVEAVSKWNDLLEPIAREAKLYSFMFEGRRAAIDILNTRRQYILAEKEAKKMLKEGIALKSDIGIAYAYQSLGYVKGFNFQYEESAAYFEKSYAIFNKLNRIESINEVCDRLIGIYSILKKYPQRLLAIQKQEAIVQQYVDKTASDQKENYLVNYLNYLNYYLDVDDLKEAERYLHLTEQYYIKGYLVYEDIYRSARISYFYKKKNMIQAITEIDTFLLASSDADTKNMWELRKAQILKDMGNYQEALMLYKKTWPIKDSLKIDLLDKQTIQLKKDYNADALLLKKQKTNNIAQISFIVLIVLILLILVWFMIHTYRVQRTLSKAEKEQIKLNHDMELANIAKEKFIANISSSIRKPLNSVLKNSLILASCQKLDLEERKMISESIITTSDQLIKLINHILDLSHLEAKMMRYNINNIELTSILKNLVTEGRHATIQMEQDKLIWTRADNDRLIKVIQSVIERPRSTNPISIEVTLLHKEEIRIIINESPLAISDPSQEVIINNEINGMIIADFKGKYVVNNSTGSICITLPAVVQI